MTKINDAFAAFICRCGKPFQECSEVPAPSEDNPDATEMVCDDQAGSVALAEHAQTCPTVLAYLSEIENAPAPEPVEIVPVTSVYEVEGKRYIVIGSKLVELT